ncbi:hypothetical protein F9K33_03580 [bacterium]|nr:MAG: hypothetical protein F9K33_03580 [bacterium]
MKKSFILDQIRLTAFVVLAFAVFSFQPLFAQCDTDSGVVINIRPDAPLQFSFFPVSLLGIGRSDANLSAFQNFGIQITNPTLSAKHITLKVELFDGSTPMFQQNLLVTLTVPSNQPLFIAVPQLLNVKSLANKRVGAPFQTPRISDDYIKKLKGGLPSGTFEFKISTSDFPTVPTSSCKSIVIQVLSGATVDVIMPANGSTVSSLPQFQWSAVGGQKFKLTIAKLKPNQTQEDALNNSSQRAIIELGSTSYQTTAGGPTGGGGATLIENNLTWNPGLLDGEYCYRVTMVQQDPITGTQNLVNSNIANFTVSGSGGTINTSGLNTDEIIGLLSAAAKGVNIADLLKGYSAFSIEINGKAATVDELRTKLGDISASAKWSIKP